MKNIQKWKESKFSLSGDTILATTDSAQLAPQSWLMANYVARCYQNAFPLYCRGHLLDLGCGKVPFYAAYKKHIEDCTCVDWSNSPHNSLHIDIECDLNGCIPLDGERFDTILMSDVLEHIYDPQHLLLECHRLLKPDGHLIINVPFLYWIHEAPFDYYRFTKFALLRMADEACFHVQTLQPVGGGLDVLADLMAKLGAFIPVLGRIIGWFGQRTAWYLSSTHLGQKISAKTNNAFSLGYFCVLKK